MNKNITSFSLIRKLYSHVDSKGKKKLLLMFFLSIIASFAEIFSIGMLIPFIGIMIDQEFVLENKILSNYVYLFPESDLLFYLTSFFIFGIATSSSIRLFLIYAGIKISNFIGSNLGKKIYTNTLNQDYLFHVEKNSSDLISILTNKIGTVTNILFSLVILSSSLIISLSILGTIFIFNPYISLITILFIGSGYLVSIYLAKKKLEKNSIIVATENIVTIKSLQEGLNNIRNIIIDNTYKNAINKYVNSYISFLNFDGNSKFIQQIPRFVLEALGVITISLIAFSFSKSIEDNGIITILAAIAFAAQRLLPLFQQLYTGLTTVLSSKQSLIEALDLLELEYTELPVVKKSIRFKNVLELKNISFSYNNKSTIFKNLNISIKKGSSIGIKGKTGSGKSTLLDIIMGLLKPSSGKILIDDLEINRSNLKSYHNIISHVPQNIHLNDDTILNNIVLNKKINQKKVNEAAKNAQILDFIKNENRKFETFVGEKGEKISGGQKQRIGIARAIYKKSKILILDESTSSLDSKTESKIMEYFFKRDDLTKIIVSHRNEIIDKCETIINLDKKGIKVIKKKV